MPMDGREATAEGRACQLWQALLPCADAREKRLARALAPLELTLPQARVLALLAGGPLGLGELARAARMANGNLTVVLANLLKRGLAERPGVPGDRRAARARLAPAGEALLPAMRAAMAGVDVALASALTDMEQEILTRLLEKLSTSAM